MVKPIRLRVDYGRLKKGFRCRVAGTHAPVFSWGGLTEEQNLYQAGYRVQVWTADATLWDSGWVASIQQEASYQGAEFAPGEKIWFSVQLRDSNGAESETATDYFYAGKLDSWQADWIAAGQDVPGKAVYFRKTIFLDRPVKQAALFVCGLGYHKVSINGADPDCSLLDPACSDYSKTCYYAVIPELEALLQPGNNTLGIILGEGWRRNEGKYLTPVRGRSLGLFGQPQLSAQLRLVYGDGQEEWICTDESWGFAHGPIVQNNLFDGETYDAEQPMDWMSERVFLPVCKTAPPGGRMEPQTLEPIWEQERYAALSVSQVGPDSYVVDFGQNIAGVVRLRLPDGMTPGQKIQMTHAEFLEEDGSLYTAPLRGAKATDTYLAQGGTQDLKWWQPVFTYHGFRYAQITGYGRPLEKEAVEAVSLYTDVALASFFRCGSGLVNQIQHNIVQTEKANIHSILTDCPQRDERMGWMNDATVRFEETPYQFDIGRLFPKITQDLLDTQDQAGFIACTAPFIYGNRPADPVCSSFLVAGLESVLHTGNLAMLSRFYEGYQAWQGYLESRSQDGIVEYSYYGDWASPAAVCEGEDGAKSLVTPGLFMSTGYFYYNALLLAKFARWLGKPDEAHKYLTQAEWIKAAMLKKWFDPDRAILATGSQGCQAFGLWLGLIPEAYREKAAKVMRDDLVQKEYKVTTGNLCTRYLFDMLTEYGYVDDAWKLINREEYPSYGYMIQNEATTIWERFELKKNPDMNSHNHPMYGAVGYWFYAYLAGIKPKAPGFAEVEIKPYYPAGLLSVQACVETVRGDLEVKWVKRYGKVHLYVTVPFGVKARIVTPGKIQEAGSGFWHYEWRITETKNEEEEA